MTNFKQIIAARGLEKAAKKEYRAQCAIDWRTKPAFLDTAAAVQDAVAQGARPAEIMRALNTKAYVTFREYLEADVSEHKRTDLTPQLDKVLKAQSEKARDAHAEITEEATSLFDEVFDLVSYNSDDASVTVRIGGIPGAETPTISEWSLWEDDWVCSSETFSAEAPVIEQWLDSNESNFIKRGFNKLKEELGLGEEADE